nr:hypothetical protein [Tanacetum cinerariifolium]
MGFKWHSQNRVGDLYTLVSIVHIIVCHYKSARHFCWWNKNVANPITNKAYSADGSRAKILLKDKVLKSIQLRRTKKGGASDLALPPENNM